VLLCDVVLERSRAEGEDKSNSFTILDRCDDTAA